MTQTSDGFTNNSDIGETSGVDPSFINPDQFPGVTRSTLRAADGTPTFIVPAADILDVLRQVRDQGRFTLLEDVTAVDWFPQEPRFQVVYHLLSLERRAVLRLKANLPGQNPSIPSATPLWAGANWYEREVFDLFGINFEGHPDMRRIEMPEDWEGHPLRKDYPVTGPRRTALPANWLRVEGRSTNPPTN